MTTSKSTEKNHVYEYTIALVGNPNVGKSSIFNKLTKLNQHTGNWSGKTVEICEGKYQYRNKSYKLIDLPGSYSLFHNSAEEQITDNFILTDKYDCLVIVADSTSLERNLFLTVQILSKTSKAVLCLNMKDEAIKKNIEIDLDELSLQLGIPVINTCSREKETLHKLKSIVADTVDGSIKTYKIKQFELLNATDSEEKKSKHISDICRNIAKQTVKSGSNAYTPLDYTLDKLFTSKLTGIPIMLMLFGIIFWITAIGANYPSEWLSVALYNIKDKLVNCFSALGVKDILLSFIFDGIYTTVAWVVSVMLPPAMIFFPLFSVLEDFGYLPRVVFNLDNAFRKAGTTGKQALTMALGFGCNACSVTGCRIMSTNKEKVLASITNSIIPCNGKLPTLIALISIFFVRATDPFINSIYTALILLILITVCVTATLILTLICSKFIERYTRPTLIMELPPYRRPQIFKCIVISVKDKVFYVLSRAIMVSAPFGALLWVFGNISVNNTSILSHLTSTLNSVGASFGLDGVIITALILCFPANELFFPIMLMSYLSKNTLTEYSSLSDLTEILTANGWTAVTAICVLVLCVFHYPCSTTCFVIKKEIKSNKVLLLSIFLPTLMGLGIAFIINLACKAIL